MMPTLAGRDFTSEFSGKVAGFAFQPGSGVGYGLQSFPACSFDIGLHAADDLFYSSHTATILSVMGNSLLSIMLIISKFNMEVLSIYCQG